MREGSVLGDAREGEESMFVEADFQLVAADCDECPKVLVFLYCGMRGWTAGDVGVGAGCEG